MMMMMMMMMMMVMVMVMSGTGTWKKQHRYPRHHDEATLAPVDEPHRHRPKRRIEQREKSR
jgi:hypothetical protein